MKKIIALSFLLCIPMFMVAQTFKIVGVNTTFSPIKEKQKIQKQLLGETIVMNFYKNSIKLHMPKYSDDIIIVEKSENTENTYYTETEDETISLTINTIFSYVRKANLTIKAKKAATNFPSDHKTVEIELERE